MASISSPDDRGRRPRSAAGTRENLDSRVTEQGSIERIWDVVEKVGVCMLTTVSAGKLRSRPVEARLDRGSGVIFVVTDVDSAKGDEIERKPDVGLVFSDTKAKAYLSITVRACVVNDRSELARAWKMTDRVWWRGGPTDPGVCFVADRAAGGGTVGRTGKHGIDALPVSKGLADRRAACARREPKGHC
jgi:general stress protein 26